VKDRFDIVVPIRPSFHNVQSDVDFRVCPEHDWMEHRITKKHEK
jgi:hypothetical protein